MQLEPWVPPCFLFGWWFSPWELWGYWLVHIVVPPTGLQMPSAPSVLSLGPPLWTLCSFSPMVGCEHLPLYLSGSGKASQETAISGSFQQTFHGIHNNVRLWWLYMGLIPRWDSLCSMLYLHICSHENVVPFSKKDQSIHTLVFLLLELHVVCEMYFGYLELLC